MGKGDKKTKRGKIFIGSHGKTRPKRSNVKSSYVPPSEPKKTEVKTSE